MSRPFHNPHHRRKSTSLDGIVSGIEYNRQHAGYNHTLFDRPTPIDSPHRQHEYEPDPGQPDFIQTSYEPYEWELHARQTPALRLDPIPRPEDRPPTYEDGVMTGAAFGHSMQQFLMEHQQAMMEAAESMRFAGQGPPISAESLEQAIEAPGQQDPLVAMLFELEERVAHMEQYAASVQPPLPDQDPDPQEIYDEQMRQFLQPFNMMGPGPMM